jgi:3-polyprenyl-4-hydroxybenzoate decarboxylase
MKIIIGVPGDGGATFGIRLLEALREQERVETRASGKTAA